MAGATSQVKLLSSLSSQPLDFTDHKQLHFKRHRVTTSPKTTSNREYKKMGKEIAGLVQILNESSEKLLKKQRDFDEDNLSMLKINIDQIKTEIRSVKEIQTQKRNEKIEALDKIAKRTLFLFLPLKWIYQFHSYRKQLHIDVDAIPEIAIELKQGEPSRDLKFEIKSIYHYGQKSKENRRAEEFEILFERVHTDFVGYLSNIPIVECETVSSALWDRLEEHALQNAIEGNFNQFYIILAADSQQPQLFIIHHKDRYERWLCTDFDKDTPNRSAKGEIEPLLMGFFEARRLNQNEDEKEAKIEFFSPENLERKLDFFEVLD